MEISQFASAVKMQSTKDNIKRNVQFSEVLVREIEQGLILLDPSTQEYSLGLCTETNSFLINYKIPLDEFELCRQQTNRVERNSESDTRNKVQRFENVDNVLLQRGQTKLKQYLLQERIIQNWHIRSDGRVYNDIGEFSSTVMKAMGNKVLTASGSIYTLGKIDPRVLHIYKMISNKEFCASEPLADTRCLLQSTAILSIMYSS